eukprot:1137221-Pelagomonas_calceolata.AAC.2
MAMNWFACTSDGSNAALAHQLLDLVCTKDGDGGIDFVCTYNGNDGNGENKSINLVCVNNGNGTTFAHLLLVWVCIDDASGAALAHQFLRSFFTYDCINAALAHQLLDFVRADDGKLSVSLAEEAVLPLQLDQVLHKHTDRHTLCWYDDKHTEKDYAYLEAACMKERPQSATPPKAREGCDTREKRAQALHSNGSN